MKPMQTITIKMSLIIHKKTMKKTMTMMTQCRPIVHHEQFFVILAREIHTCIEHFDLKELKHDPSNEERGSKHRNEMSKASDTTKTRDIMSILLCCGKDHYKLPGLHDGSCQDCLHMDR